jgi:NADH-quinone oxidoreductase E subunit
MSDAVPPVDRPQAPPRDQVELKFSPRAVKELEKLFGHYPDRKSAILPALWIAQREYGGYLPPNALAEVAVRLGRPYAEIEGVATFYSMLERREVGKHVIEVCTCMTCHVRGAYRILDYLLAKLGIGLNETTPDGMFTVKEVECLGACDRAPLLQVGSEYVGPVDERKIDELIAGLREAEESRHIQLASDIIRSHLTAAEQAEIGGEP